MATRKSILFFTSSEHGQANVVLAVAHELLLTNDFDVHIASFSPLRPRVVELSQTIAKHDKTKNLTFHAITGLTMMQMLYRIPEEERIIGPHPSGFNGALHSYKALPQLLAGWTGAEYVETAESSIEIIRIVKPCIAVIDSFFNQAIVACDKISQKYMILSPNSLKDIITVKQPKAAMFWKYPAPYSSFPYPVPWSCIPANLYLNIRLILVFLTSPAMRHFAHQCSELGIKKLPFGDPCQDGIHYLCPSALESEFHVDYIPPNVHPCGPITLIVQPVSESDPELAAWLKRRPTILLNLGSHMESDGKDVTAMATGLRIVLDRCANLQVLWKLKSKVEMMDNLTKILGTELLAGIVRVEPWLAVDPIAILRSGNVICSVHHGGVNSYFEAVETGIPHVVLPLWSDTYDYAIRVEYLGIGVYGNRTAAPRAEAAEFSEALMKVVGGGEEARSMVRKAQELAAICDKAGGRKIACQKILEEINNVD